MKIFAKVSIALSISTLAFLLSFCTTKPTQTSGGSETGNVALVSGELYKATGPAIGAEVYFVKVNYNPHTGTLAKAHAIMDTVTTDSAGRYGTNILDTGTYNVFGVGTDGNLSLLDSIHITGDTQALPPDTLKAPSSIAGTLKMYFTDSPGSVFIIMFGTGTVVLPQLTGGFSLANLAEGSYSVRFLSTLDRYLPLDTTLRITAGTPLTLPDSIVLPLKIPTPAGFKAAYDTLKQIVTLTWGKGDSARVKGYNVYRQHVDSAEVKVNALPLLSPLYIDSTGGQDQIYIYSVVAVDFENKEGIRTAGDTVKIVPLYSFVRGWGSIRCADSQFCTPSSMTMDSKGNLFVTNRGLNNVVKYDTAGHLLLKIGSLGVDSGKFQEPWDVEIDRNGQIFIADYGNGRIQRFDSTGKVNLIIRCDSASVAVGFTPKPRYIQVDSIGNVYIIAIRSTLAADNAYQAFLVYDSSGALKSSTNLAPLIENKWAGDLVIRNSRIFISAGDLYIFSLNLSSPDHISNIYSPINIVSDSLIYCSGYYDSPMKITDFSGKLIARFGKRPDYTAPWATWTSTTDASLCGLVVDANFNIFTCEIDASVFAIKKFKRN